VNFINFLQVFIFIFSPNFFAEEVNYIDGKSVEAKGNVVFETEDLTVLSEFIKFDTEYSSFSSTSLTELISGNLVFSLAGIHGEFDSDKNSIEKLASENFQLDIKSLDPLSPSWIFEGEDFLYENKKWTFSNINFGNWEPLPNSGFLISAKKCTLEKIEGDLYELNFEDVDFYILSKKIFSLKKMKRQFRSEDEFSNILTFAPVLQNHQDEGIMLSFKLKDFGAFGGLLSSSLTTSESGKTELFIDGKLPIGDKASFSIGLGSVFEVDKNGNGYWISSSPSYKMNTFSKNGNQRFDLTLQSGRFSVDDSPLFNVSGGSLIFEKEFKNSVFDFHFSRFSGNSENYESIGSNLYFKKDLTKSNFVFGLGQRQVEGLNPIPSRQGFSWEGPYFSSFVNFSEGWAFRTVSEWDINKSDFVTNEISLIKSFNGIALEMVFDTEEKLLSFSFELMSF